MAPARLRTDSNRLLRGEILCRWQQLTNADIEDNSGDRSQLVALLETRYGYARRRAEKEVDLFFGDFRDRLRMAA